MLKYLLVALLSISSIVNAGFSASTLVQTPQGYKNIETLQVGDEILSYSRENTVVTDIVVDSDVAEIENTITITTFDNESFTVSSEQRILVPCKWVQADSLSVGDAVFARGGKLVRIKSIVCNDDAYPSYGLVVKNNGNLFVGRNGLLVHNGVGGAAVGGFIGWAVPTAAFNGFYGAVASGVGSFAGPVAAAAVAGTVRAACMPVQIAVTKTSTLWCSMALAVATGPV